MGKGREVKLLELIFKEIKAIRRHLDKEAAAKSIVADLFGGKTLQIPKAAPERPFRGNGKSTVSATLYGAILRDSQPPEEDS